MTSIGFVADEDNEQYKKIHIRNTWQLLINRKLTDLT
jgi:hypothetical protein